MRRPPKQTPSPDPATARVDEGSHVFNQGVAQPFSRSLREPCWPVEDAHVALAQCESNAKPTGGLVSSVVVAQHAPAGMPTTSPQLQTASDDSMALTRRVEGKAGEPPSYRAVTQPWTTPPSAVDRRREPSASTSKLVQGE